MAILLCAVLAAFFFSKELQQKGYRSRRPLFYPFITGAVIYVFQLLVTFAVSASLDAEKHADFLKFHSAIIAFIALGCYFALIAKAWKQIRALPSKPSKPASS
ncbi:MAG: hypothetical protein QM627_07585 [Luteolibacter sp.]